MVPMTNASLGLPSSPPRATSVSWRDTRRTPRAVAVCDDIAASPVTDSAQPAPAVSTPRTAQTGTVCFASHGSLVHRSGALFPSAADQDLNWPAFVGGIVTSRGSMAGTSAVRSVRLRACAAAHRDLHACVRAARLPAAPLHGAIISIRRCMFTRTGTKVLARARNRSKVCVAIARQRCVCTPVAADCIPLGRRASAHGDAAAISARSHVSTRPKGAPPSRVACWLRGYGTGVW
ncbi:hypothetical protein ABB37_08941 [Leptomonas pyrrhocoris]|uniref:Uncharacterized protein n=1 Tax=Leptomonas pyrrhocoris TaxID=157538 RepID=A0A0M9FSE4_LEPPY|nr:hypothetical protein ABB37_08941 [Leptomonas pyrrhocoris]KPA74979.1 hypothetical protein ABB37_08941 [Leptomonas pyrrhocoris]|eukprot:XP_015653418.1 hypothetical protein ABB37_08941 [Leptomonas pyrrhocoris]